jgi:large repetitive protein
MDRNVAHRASADASVDIVKVIQGGEQTVHSEKPLEDAAHGQGLNHPAMLAAVAGAPNGQVYEIETSKIPQKTAPRQEPVASDGDAPAQEPLGVHQGNVGSTAFLDRSLGGDFAMGQGLDMAAFSAKAGSSAERQDIAEEPERHDPLVGEYAEGGGNHPPVVSGPVDLGSMDEDWSLTVTLADLLANATDVDGDTLSVAGLTVDPGIGTVTGNGDGTWTFTPAADWNGNVSFTYAVIDGNGGTAAGTASLTVNPVNDAPVVSGPVSLGAMDEDGSLVITLADLLTNATDVDGDTLSVTGLSLASGEGVLTGNGDGTWTFTPAADWNGSVSFTYAVIDGNGGTAAGTASLTVSPVNDAPVVSGSVSLGAMDEDGSLVVTLADLLANATDVDGDTLSVTGLTVDPGIGTVTDNGDGTWTFTPAADWNGNVSFTYAVIDGNGGTAAGTASLTVNPVNDAPVVSGPVSLGAMDEDGSLVITLADLLTNATDVDGDTLSVTGLSLASGEGVLTGNGDGTWTFTPAADWNGSVSFTYAVIDGNGGTAAGTASLTVSPVNDAPVVSGSVSLGAMDEDGSLVVTLADLLANATDVDGDTLSVTGLTVDPGIGTVTDNGDGTWTFTPAPDWHGPVTFDYTVSDGQGGTAPATASLTVSPVNDAPVVSGPVSLGAMDEDGSLTITLADLLANATDVDGDTLSVTGLSLASGEGVLTGNGDGTWTFTPAPDWHGSVSFSYTVDDGYGGTAAGTASLTVNPVNDAPVVSGSVSLGVMDEDGSLVITLADLLANATDVDGDTLSVTGLTVDPGIGTVTDNGDGTWTFTPAPDWHGSVSFSYTVDDGYGGTAAASAQLTVNPVNDAPVVGGPVSLGAMDEDGSLVITLADLLANATDVDGDTLSVTGLTVDPGIGTVTDNGDGTWTFTPAPDWYGSVSFTYAVIDGNGGTAAGTASLTVNPVNDAPVVATNSILSVQTGQTAFLAGSLLTTDVDNEAADLWYTIIQGPVTGVLLLDGVELSDFSQPVFTQADIDTHRVTFRLHVPTPGGEVQVFEAEDSFVFTVGDGSLSTGPTTFVIRNGATQVWGTDGDDDLTGVTNFDAADTAFHVYGFGGNDVLRGGAGADTLDGGAHDHAATGPYTWAGGDTVDYGASSAAVDIDLTRATQIGGHAEGDSLIGIENVIGSAYNDSIVGDEGHNFLDGGAGDDTLRGGAGDDTLVGGAGADLLDGGAGQDLADYSGSASWVNVNLTLQDGIAAQSGGGAGNHAEGDTLIGIEHLVGSNDATHGDVLTGNAGNNLLIGLDGDDTLIGGAGNDTLIGGAGADRLDGGVGTRDLADYSASPAWINVDLTLQNGTAVQSGGGAGNHAEGDILTGIEDVNCSEHDDFIIGSSANNVIHGYGGNDTIDGGAGHDTIRGGDGDDLIYGGTGADIIFGDAGNDTIYGGPGSDSIWGGAGDDYLVGGGPDDNSRDLLIGGTGNDTLVATSGLGARDTLIGGPGADRIIGDGDSSVSYEITDDFFTLNYTPVYLDLRIQDGVTAQSGGPEGNDAIGDIITGCRHAVGTSAGPTR